MRARGLPGTLLLLIPLFVLTTVSCSPPVDLSKGLQVQVVSTGWLDAGIVDGKNKLVPII